jgi:hypothetical protein
MYTIFDFAWPVTQGITTTTPFQFFSPDELLFAKDLIGEVSSYFAYLRFDLEVQFRLNTNQFYSGQLMVSQFPGTPLTAEANKLCARAWLSPKIISAQKQDVLVIRLPWLDAHRFGPVPPVTKLWTVFIDVLAPLRVAAANAPDTINVTVYGRLVNPQLVAPFDANITRRPSQPKQTHMTAAQLEKLQKSKAEKQSGLGTRSSFIRQGGIPVPRTRKVIVHRSAARADPVESSNGISEYVRTLLPATTIASIGTTSSALIGILKLLHPAATALGTLLALFDKPNLARTQQRVITQTAVNLSMCDSPDQALPLTLYKTSYLGTDQNLIPGGKDWTFREIAMTPGLFYAQPFTSLEDLLYITLAPGAGTPWQFAYAQCIYWHGSTRVRIDFVCSSFLSARFILIFVPALVEGSPTVEIDNNVCEVVDVRGDTTVEFTFPWVYPVDWLTQYGPFNAIKMQLYDAIASVDSVADPTIDVVVWTAAGPDCQFSRVEQVSGTYFRDISWGDRVKKQCDIQESFTYEFPAFVPGCTYTTDNHYVTSETTERVTDVLKRYVNASLAALNLNPTGSLPMEYNPLANTVQWQLKSGFLFHRGGVSYKLVCPRPYPTGGGPVTGVFAVRLGLPALGSDNYVLDGGSSVIQGAETDEVSFTIPWFWYLHYYQVGSTQTAIEDPMFPSLNVVFPSNFAQYTVTTSGSSPQAPYVYTCVRDDYQVGFLHYPLLNTIEKDRKLAPLKFATPTCKLRPREETFKVIHKAKEPAPASELRKGFFGTTIKVNSPKGV